MKPSAEDMAFFRALPELDEPALAALIEIAELEEAPPRRELVREGVVPERLYYVVEGEMLLEKGGRIRRVNAGIFIGEISFVLGEPASATVILDRGGRCISFDAEALRKLSRQNAAIAAGLDTAFKQDLARKVARS